MLIVEDTQYFETVVEHAKTIGLYDGDDNGSLKKKLDYLDNYRSRESTRTRLFRDFAPHSFGFVIEVKHGDEWRHLFTGGLIFHGPHDGLGSGAAPAFSVTLAASVGWSIHT